MSAALRKTDAASDRADNRAAAAPPRGIESARHEITLDERFPVPGGMLVIRYVRLRPKMPPYVSIISEPDAATPERTRLRDAVALLEELRKWGEPRHVQMLHDADAGLRRVFLPALMLMGAP